MGMSYGDIIWGYHMVAILDLSSSGIGLIAETLQAIDCNEDEWKMCSFLKVYAGGSVDMTYFGEMLPARVTMTARKEMHFELGRELFFRDEVTSKIDSTEGGDELKFIGNVHLTRTSDKFQGMYKNMYIRLTELLTEKLTNKPANRLLA